MAEETEGLRSGASWARGAQGWPGAHALAALHECNECCLELLQAHVRPARPGDPFACALRPLLQQLDAPARARAARCTVLLVDPGFGDARRWARALEGVAPALEYTAPAYFDAEGATELARVVLTCAGHLAYSDAAVARLLLGMAPGCIEAFAAGTVSGVARLAGSHWPWFRPRWQNRLRFWRDLLDAAIQGTPAAQARMQVRGLQLLAAEARPG